MLATVRRCPFRDLESVLCGILRCPLWDLLKCPLRDLLECPLRDLLECPLRDLLRSRFILASDGLHSFLASDGLK